MKGVSPLSVGCDIHDRIGTMHRERTLWKPERPISCGTRLCELVSSGNVQKYLCLIRGRYLSIKLKLFIVITCQYFSRKKRKKIEREKRFSIPACVNFFIRL